MSSRSGREAGARAGISLKNVDPAVAGLKTIALSQIGSCHEASISFGTRAAGFGCCPNWRLDDILAVSFRRL